MNSLSILHGLREHKTETSQPLPSPPGHEAGDHAGSIAHYAVCHHDCSTPSTQSPVVSPDLQSDGSCNGPVFIDAVNQDNNNICKLSSDQTKFSGRDKLSSTDLNLRNQSTSKVLSPNENNYFFESLWTGRRAGPNKHLLDRSSRKQEFFRQRFNSDQERASYTDNWRQQPSSQLLKCMLLWYTTLHPPFVAGAWYN